MLATLQLPQPGKTNESATPQIVAQGYWQSSVYDAGRVVSSMNGVPIGYFIPIASSNASVASRATTADEFLSLYDLSQIAAAVDVASRQAFGTALIEVRRALVFDEELNRQLVRMTIVTNRALSRTEMRTGQQLVYAAFDQVPAHVDVSRLVLAFERRAH